MTAAVDVLFAGSDVDRQIVDVDVVTARNAHGRPLGLRNVDSIESVVSLET